MDSEKAIRYIETSFLSNLLIDENITDISYNGDSIFYLDNVKGRCLSNIKISFETAKDFIRQLANICEQQFSFQKPELDVSFGRYRLNAVHQSIARRNNENVLNFSLRIGSTTLRIKPNTKFLPEKLVALFDVLIDSQCSIVIGGETGTGKTEFQKYLLSRMEKNTRVIIIDNVLELDYSNINSGIDLNIWQASDFQQENSIQNLIINALRSNPDWLIVAEARGSEMVDVLNSSLTGHPIITTLHAKDVFSMPNRMARMVMMGDKKVEYNDVLEDIAYNLKIYVYLKRRINNDGSVDRYISDVCYLNNKEWFTIYKMDEDAVFNFPPDYILKTLRNSKHLNDLMSVLKGEKL